MTIEFDPQPIYFTPLRGTLASFGSAASGKAVKTASFTFQGNSGSGWTTITADQYNVRRKTGYVEIREVDDSGNLVDWQSYMDYQGLGNTAFRATYTVKNGATETTYTNEAVTMADADPYLGAGDGSFDGELPQNLFVDEIHANYGEIGGWILSSTQITSDSGNAFMDSSVPSIGLGATGYQTGTGFWVGKSGGSYKLSLGDATSKQLYWDGSALTAGGFTIGADYLRDTANSFGLASTVTGGDDVRFWAGDTFANRATAPLQLYESGYIFAKDIVLARGSLSGASGGNGYGYAVNPLFLCHYDGARPYSSDFRGSAIGHNGQPETRSGGLIFRVGKFSKAVQVAIATTNLVPNPSFETNVTGWTEAHGYSITQSSDYSYFGTYSMKCVAGIAGMVAPYITPAIAVSATAYTWSAYIRFADERAVTTSNSKPYLQAYETWDTISDMGNGWYRCIVTRTMTAGNVSPEIDIYNVTNGTIAYIDGVQFEQTSKYTMYCDGSLGDGHSWSGTAHASTSSRTAATLTYAASGNINLAQGTISLWYFEPGAQSGFPRLFSARIDGSNYLVLNMQNSGALTPFVDFRSGGSGSSSVSGATTVTTGWHHFVATWTSGALKCYIDGTQSGATPNYTAPSGTLSTIEVGTFNSSEQPNTVIDDLCILPIVLTNHEIKAIYYSDAPLMLGVNSQELRLSGAGLGDVFGNANGLFGRNASGTPSFGLINGTVNTNTWGGASEVLDSGDLLLGDNNTSKANMLYDASAGQLKFRGGTTTNLYIDTSGVLGFNSVNGDGTNTGYAQWFNNSAARIGQLIGEYGTATSAGAAAGVEMLGYSDTSGRNGFVQLTAVGFTTSNTPAVRVTSDGVTTLDMRSGSVNTAHTQALTVKTKPNTTTVSNVAAYFDSQPSSGSAAAGFGTSMTMRAHDASGNMIEQVHFGGIWKNATAGTADASFYLGVAANSSYTEVLRILSSGKLSVGGSGVTDPTDFFEFNDGNDKQANIRADAAAQNDDGWVTAVIDYGEYVEKADYAETLEIGDIVFISGRKATKAHGGTPMVVSTRTGFRTGDPLQWNQKWLPEAEYNARYGTTPQTIWAWARKHGKPLPTKGIKGQRKIQPRKPIDKTSDGLKVLNPEWDSTKEFVPRSERPNEWIVVAFSGQVRVNVRGKVNEGDFIVPSGDGDGYGMSAPRTVENSLRAVGVAWESKDDTAAGQVMVAVGVR